MPGTAHASRCKKFADLRARNTLAAQSHLGIDVDLESHLAAKLGQHGDVTRCFVSEAEVESFMYFARMQFLSENALHELPRRHQGKVAPKGKQQYGVDSRAFQPTQFFRRWREQFQSCFRFQDSRGMRLKRHRDGLASGFPSPGDNLA